MAILKLAYKFSIISMIKPQETLTEEVVQAEEHRFLEKIMSAVLHWLLLT